MTKSFCIFNIFINYNTIPILSSLIHLLGNKGVPVDLVSVGNQSSFKQKEKLRTITLKHVLFNSFAPFVILVKWFPRMFHSQYTHIIAVDPTTLIPAVILGKLFNKKLFYISLEVYVKKDINNVYYRYYYLQQRYLLRFFDKIIIMDKDRKKMLLDNTSIKHPDKKFLFLPNSTLQTDRKTDSHFLHDRLKINRKKKILLIAGEIGERSYASELYLISRKLPPDFVIVMHSRRVVHDATNDLPDDEKFKISQQPVEIEFLDVLFSSAYIGLSLYKVAASGIEAENVRNIGKSSGKLNNFLKLGIPVIMSRLPFFEEIENRYQCGVCIDDMDGFLDALNEISGQYAGYKQNAIACYSSELHFESAFEETFSELI